MTAARFSFYLYLAQMETLQLAQRIEQLPAAAQRLVAELVDLLSQHTKPLASKEELSASQGATILPALDTAGVPTTWPENVFADPEFYGMWADREDMKNGGDAYIHVVRRGQQPPH